MKKCLIIGGGPAGMMAAIAAARNGCNVTIFEKNEKLGKKLFITGKGRCNLTNACEHETFFDSMPQNSKFMYSAFYGMDNYAVMNFFEEAGCKLKTERGNRVFPVSDHSSDVIRALERELSKLKIAVCLQTKVQKICTKKDENGAEKVCGVLLENQVTVEGDAVIIATGGKSYPLTGSTGDGYRLARECGHNITPLVPSLVSLLTEETNIRGLQGISLKNVTLTLRVNGKKRYSELGEMLFTHDGVSGPLVLTASSYLAAYAGAAVLEIDLKPALSEEQLHRRFIREFEANINKSLKNILPALYPVALSEVIAQNANVSGDKKAHEITKEERERLVAATKKFVLHVRGTANFDEAIITHGGVGLKEINPSTMESKVTSGLFFAGEVLDLDAKTGGFNLQIAWSTGYLAGESTAIFS